MLGNMPMAWSQNSYKQSTDSYITVAGTSTLHDWTMTTHEPQVQVAFDVANSAITQLKTLYVTVECKSLKSAHAAMDKNAYSSLKADKFKSITFKMTSATVQDKSIQCPGSLTIAGVTKTIQFTSVYELKADGTVRVTGSVPFKMSDYQVDPPTFMFGTVKTGNDITVTFNLQLTQIKA
jgi:polyisoprenoid-binding protein YceI